MNTSLSLSSNVTTESMHGLLTFVAVCQMLSMTVGDHTTMSFEKAEFFKLCPDWQTFGAIKK